MKIVYCIAGLYNSAGMERVITVKANYLSRLGHEVYVVTAEQQGRPLYYQLLPKVTHVDIGINYSEHRSFIKKLLSVYKKRKLHKSRLTEFLQVVQADIVISTFGNEIFFLHSIKDGSKKVVEIHFCKGYRIRANRRGFFRIIDYIRTFQENRLTSKYDAFVTLTEEDKLNWNNNNLWAIPNPIYNYPTHKSDLTNKNIIVVGRFSYQKRYDRLMKVWSIVSPLAREWHLSIYGDGEEYEKIVSMAYKKNISSTISFHKPRKDLSEAYTSSSCLLLTSRYEGLPMVLLEAISYGIPVVSFACPCGPKDVIKDGFNGFLIRDNQVELFAERLLTIMKDDRLRIQMGNNALQCSANYSIDIIMNRWLNLFTSLL